jgi:hypothetical protein
MRLLKLDDDGSFSLIDFPGDMIPSYAILSHTWEADNEVTFQDFKDGVESSKAGYRKIQFCGEQARKDGLQYFWVDSCCINQTNSVELHEAINSMFRWYSKSQVCYAYLSDVQLDGYPDELVDTGKGDFLRPCRWFTRGWTLQELLAPKKVIFFDSNWKRIGTKVSYCKAISSITGINAACLLEPSKLFGELHATRMGWASKRKTSRDEDIAYCLMGMFNLHMPLGYGEGKSKAFKRLLHELVRVSSGSHSLLAWGLDSEVEIEFTWDHSRIFPWPHTPEKLFAPSPNAFSRQSAFYAINTRGIDGSHWIITNLGIEFEMMITTHETWFVHDLSDESGVGKRYDLAIGIIPMSLSERGDGFVGMLLSGNSVTHTYNRISCPERGSSVMVPARLAITAKRTKICLTDNVEYRQLRPPSTRRKHVLVNVVGFKIQDILLHKCDWIKDRQSLILHRDTPNDIQRSMFRVVAEKDPQSHFCLLVSNSVIVVDATWPVSSELEYWRFRKLGMEVVQNDHADKLFSDSSESSQQVGAAVKNDMTVDVGNMKARITLEEKEVFWDLKYVLEIVAIPSS